MARRLTGALYTYRTHALYVGPLIAAVRHEHHAGQVMWAPGGVYVEGEHGPARRVVVHCFRPHEAHSHGSAAAAAVLWVDRDDLRWAHRSGGKRPRVGRPYFSGIALGSRRKSGGVPCGRMWFAAQCYFFPPNEGGCGPHGHHGASSSGDVYAHNSDGTYFRDGRTEPGGL